MITNKDNFCVIMGGGIGSRFWPFSRKTLPKQFLDFIFRLRAFIIATNIQIGSSKYSLQKRLVVTNDLYADLVKEQLPEFKLEQILLQNLHAKHCPALHGLLTISVH